MAHDTTTALGLPPQAVGIRIDPVLLRRQKQALFDLLNLLRQPSDGPHAEAIRGLLGLLDAIQDALADEYGEDAVFGAPEPNGKDAGA
jgi:hypothetical protein